MKRATLGLVLGVLALLLLPVPAASAHTDLLSATPADGAVLAQPPTEVVLAFSEDLLPDAVVISVTDDTGFTVRVLSFTVDGSDVTVTWPPGMPGTEYDLNYRVVSQDGHPVSGTVRYTLSSPPAAASPPAAGTSTAATAAPPGSATASPAPAVSAIPAAATGEDSGLTAPLAAAAAAVAVGLVAIGVIGVVVIVRRRGGATGP